jgi:hypothetical protein
MPRKKAPLPIDATPVVKFEYFEFNISKIHSYWKSLYLFEDAIAYLLRAKTEAARCSDSCANQMLKNNDDNFREKCNQQTQKSIAWVTDISNSTKKQIEILADDIRLCFIQELDFEIDELEADRLARYKQSIGFYRLDWSKSLEELRMLFEFLIIGNYIKAPYGINMAIQNLCLHNGNFIPYSSINSIRNYSGKDKSGEAFINRLKAFLSEYQSDSAE